MRTRRVAVGVVMTLLALSALGGAGGPAGAAPTVGHMVGNCEIVADPTPIAATACTSVVIAGASLAGQNLAYANFTDAVLTGTDLAGAVLTGATLTRADLAGADLRGADLTDATLDDADLARADLVGAGITGAEVHGTVWKDTACPDGSNSDRDAGTCANDSVVLEGEAFSPNPVPQEAPAPPYQAHPATEGSNPAVASTPATPGGSSVAHSDSDSGAGSLPFTGVPVALLLAIGAALVGAGLLLVVGPGLGRHRRKPRSSGPWARFPRGSRPGGPGGSLGLLPGLASGPDELGDGSHQRTPGNAQ